MAIYKEVINGVVGTKTLQKGQRLGSTYFSGGATDATFAAHGYYPVIKDNPALTKWQKISDYTEVFDPVSKVINATAVIVDRDKNEVRASMILTPAQARIKLASINLLDTVNTSIAALPESSAMKIKWNHATSVERLDADLIAFCKDELSMTDSDIDALFEV